MENNNKRYEFDFLDKARIKLHRYIFFDLAESDRNFAGYLKNEGVDLEMAREACNKEESSDGVNPFDFENQYNKAFDYFDDWATVDITLKESGDRYEDPEITGFGLVKKSEPHIETCDRSDFGRTVRYLAEDGTEEFE